MSVLSFGNGAIPLRKIDKILKAHSYRLDRYNGDHRIYINDDTGEHISIAPKCATPQIKRLFKEHNIDKNILNKGRN